MITKIRSTLGSLFTRRLPLGDTIETLPVTIAGQVTSTGTIGELASGHLDDLTFDANNYLQVALADNHMAVSDFIYIREYSTGATVANNSATGTGALLNVDVDCGGERWIRWICVWEEVTATGAPQSFTQWFKIYIGDTTPTYTEILGRAAGANHVNINGPWRGRYARLAVDSSTAGSTYYCAIAYDNL